MIETLQTNNVKDLIEIIKIAEKHPNPEYSCDFNTYAKFLLWAFNSPNYLFFIMKKGELVIGYMILVFIKNIIQNDVVVFDLCLDEEYRKQGYILNFVKLIYGLADKYKIDNFKWNSYILPEKYWAKFIPCKYHTDTVYIISRNDFLESIGEK